MDPNASKKHLLNKLSKEEALKRLHAEDFKRVTVSFYRYVMIEILQLYVMCFFKSGKNCRFWVEFIWQRRESMQLSVPEHLWEKFVTKVHNQKEFENIPFKIAVEDDGKSFFKLTIKVRRQIHQMDFRLMNMM